MNGLIRLAKRSGQFVQCPVCEIRGNLQPVGFCPQLLEHNLQCSVVCRFNGGDPKLAAFGELQAGAQCLFLT